MRLPQVLPGEADVDDAEPGRDQAGSLATPCVGERAEHRADRDTKIRGRGNPPQAPRALVRLAGVGHMGLDDADGPADHGEGPVLLEALIKRPVERLVVASDLAALAARGDVPPAGALALVPASATVVTVMAAAPPAPLSASPDSASSDVPSIPAADSVAPASMLLPPPPPADERILSLARQILADLPQVLAIVERESSLPENWDGSWENFGEFIGRVRVRRK